MSRLLVVVYLAATAMAMYREPSASIAMRVNFRQMQLFNSGQFELLVKELYQPEASIYIKGRGAIASGHDQILSTIKKQAGYKITNIRLGLVNVPEDSEFFIAKVAADVTTNYGKKVTYNYQQALYQGKIAFVLADLGDK